jgi:hypothetical protein
MNGHLNRKQFNRCVWSAAMMLVGSAAACLVDSGLKSILPKRQWPDPNLQPRPWERMRSWRY